MKTLKQVPVLVTLLLLVCVSQAQQRARVINANLSEDSVAARAKKINLVAAFQKKQVDLIVVADRSLADFEVNGFAQSQRAGWAKIIFGTGLPESEASIQLVNLRTGVVSYAVASYKVDSLNGNKSTAEHLAKNLRQKMERDEKRIR